MVGELLQHHDVEGCIRERGIAGVRDDASSGSERLAVVDPTGVQRVRLEIDHPRVETGAVKEPRHPSRAASELERPGAGNVARHVLQQADQRDGLGSAHVEELLVELHTVGGALPPPLLLHRHGDQRLVGRRVSHEHQALPDRVGLPARDRHQTVTVEHQRFERVLRAEWPQIPWKRRRFEGHWGTVQRVGGCRFAVQLAFRRLLSPGDRVLMSPARGQAHASDRTRLTVASRSPRLNARLRARYAAKATVAVRIPGARPLASGVRTA